MFYMNFALSLSSYSISRVNSALMTEGVRTVYLRPLSIWGRIFSTEFTMSSKSPPVALSIAAVGIISYFIASSKYMCRLVYPQVKKPAISSPNRKNATHFSSSTLPLKITPVIG